MIQETKKLPLKMKGSISHVNREGNSVVDTLANWSINEEDYIFLIKRDSLHSGNVIRQMYIIVEWDPIGILTHFIKKDLISHDLQNK